MPDFQPDLNMMLNYSFTGDIAAMALCLVLAGLIGLSRVRRGDKRVSIMYVIIIEVFVAGMAHIVGEQQILSRSPNVAMVYVLRTVNYTLLTFVLLMYTLYLYEPLWIPHRKQIRNFRAMFAVTIAVIIADILCSVLGFGFRINERGTVTSTVNLYVILYYVFVGQIMAFIVMYRSRLIPQVFWSLMMCNLISASLMLTQLLNGNLSYTTLAYLLPVVGMTYMFHANPYDVSTGAVSEAFFVDELRECVEKQRKLIVITCLIRGFDEAIRVSNEYRTSYFNFIRSNVRRGILYRFQDGRLVLTLRGGKDEAADRAMLDKILAEFRESYEKYRQEFKVIIFETSPEITEMSDYLRLMEFVDSRTPNNETRFITEDDRKAYFSSRYILSQLEDIAQKNDLDDPRVLVFCQPVYNLSKQRFDTAEALMRLSLEKTGMVYPDQFIPLAEQNGLIHSLTRVILNKTCAAIRDFIEEGYVIRRVSVNFSVADLRYDAFCTEVEHIIDRHGIPYDSIAVEITESRSDDDFHLMKEKVEELQKLGIKFYLDDFGTGYSNFERIMEIPFDIIKFDRSMLLEFSKNDASRYMVNTFADMFNELHYSVLFEGVETDADEQHCVEMKAKFLQGYKYSRPIPIADLRKFLSKKTE